MTSSNGNIFRVTGLLCGEFTGPRWIPSQRPVTRSLDVFFDLCLNKKVNKQWWAWWSEIPSSSLWRQCNGCAYENDWFKITVVSPRGQWGTWFVSTADGSSIFTKSILPMAISIKDTIETDLDIWGKKCPILITIMNASMYLMGSISCQLIDDVASRLSRWSTCKSVIPHTRWQHRSWQG